MDEYDGPWKEAIEEWFEAFLAFFFPAIQAQVDWSRGYEFLDKELQQLAPESASGARIVDKLVKVFWKSGDEVWILIHIEVQTQADRQFPRRMYVYRYRIDDKFDRPAISLAILADEDANWRPEEYRQAFAGCDLRFRFPVVKLLDFASREDWLEQHANPFAVVILSHLKTQQTRGNPDERTRWKTRLVKGLYNRGYDATQIRGLFRLIDWQLNLPRENDKLFWNEIASFEREQRMPYITSVERIGIEKGLEEGMEKGMEKGLEKGIEKGTRAGIETVLELKFGAAGLALVPEFESITNPDALMRILKGLKTAQSIEEARRLWS